MFHKCTFPTSILLSAVALKNASTDSKSSNQVSDNDLSHYKCKPNELPLYAPLHSYNKPQQKRHTRSTSAAHSTIESGVHAVRLEVQKAWHLIDNQKNIVVGYYHHAEDKTLSAIDYLNQPHNMLPRSGAIAVGGLSGFIFAARGGFIKKVLYTTIGAGAIASLCYPRQAEVYAREALIEARKGYAIAYNFVKGVKPGEGIPVEPINKFPTSLEDIKFLAIDLYEEAKEALFAGKK